MSCTIVAIPGTNNRACEPAAKSYQRMLRDSPYHNYDYITSGWRDPAEQERLFRERYRPCPNSGCVYGDTRYWDGVCWCRVSSAGPVAVPGTSLHETGLALDIAEPLRSWVRDHGHKYGWFLNPEIAAIEPWHFEYNQSRDEFDGEDEFMSDEQYDDLKFRIDRVWKTVRPGEENEWPDGPLAHLVRHNRDIALEIQDQQHERWKAVELTELSHAIIEQATDVHRDDPVVYRDAASYSQATAYAVQFLMDAVGEMQAKIQHQNEVIEKMFAHITHDGNEGH